MLIWPQEHCSPHQRRSKSNHYPRSTTPLPLHIRRTTTLKKGPNILNPTNWRIPVSRMGQHTRGSRKFIHSLPRQSSHITIKQTTGKTITTTDSIKNLKLDRKSTRLNSSHVATSYAVF